MSGILDTVETKLNDLFGKKAPKLPDNGKNMLVQWMPIIALVVGLGSLWSAYNLWHWAHVASSLTDYAQVLCNSYSVSGCGGVSHYSLWLWLGVAFVAAEGVLYLLAYPGLKAHSKAGWNYLFYGALLNVLYAVVSLFTDYNSGTTFVGSLIGSAIGFYFLFQIRGSYLGKRTAGAHKA